MNFKLPKIFFLFNYLDFKLGFNSFWQSSLVNGFFDFNSPFIVFTIPLDTSFLFKKYSKFNYQIQIDF